MQIIFFLLPLLAFLVMFVPGLYWQISDVSAFKQLGYEEQKKFVRKKFPKVTTGITVVIWLILAIFVNSFTIVEYGTTAVVTRLGQVTDRILEPGAHLKNPLTEGLVVFNTQKVTYEALDNQNESQANYKDYPVDTTTADGQQINVRYTIRFAIDPTKVQWIANNLGTESNVVEKVVKTESRVYVRNIIRNYTAEQLYTGDILDAQEAIRASLEPTFSANGIVLDSFGLRQVNFQQEYVDAVESKQVEKEKVEAQKHIAEQEEFKKEAAITKAEGEAKAQGLQRQTLSNELLFKLWIEKWDGKLPQYMLGDDANTLIQLPN